LLLLEFDDALLHVAHQMPQDSQQREYTYYILLLFVSRYTVPQEVLGSAVGGGRGKLTADRVIVG